MLITMYTVYEETFGGSRIPEIAPLYSNLQKLAEVAMEVDTEPLRAPSTAGRPGMLVHVWNGRAPQGGNLTDLSDKGYDGKMRSGTNRGTVVL